jgi:nucleotide-binding universal stress UspA family protein
MNAALSQWHGGAAGMRQLSSSVANIVIPLDGGPLSRIALPIGRRLAEIHNATLHLLYVGRQSGGLTDVLSLLGLKNEDICGAVLDVPVGDAAEVIARAAQDLPHSLIVMCTHNETPSNPDSFGQVAESVLAGSPSRIVLVAPERGDRAWNPQLILLAHDGTCISDAATAPAAEVALRASAEVVALHIAARKAPSHEEPGSLPAPRYVDQPQHEWPAWTREFMDRMLALGAPASTVHFDLVVAGGQPGSEIAEIARRRQVDLVVMAWDGKWNYTRHAATRVVIRGCGCPVLLVCSASET